MTINRRATLVTLLSTLTAGCGGGGGDSSGATGGSTTTAIYSQRNATNYPLNVYVPPGTSTDRGSLPVVYLLDGDSRFPTLVAIVESLGLRVIIVGIGNEANRSHDYVPANMCTANGGGHAEFFDFIRLELTPFIESKVGGDPARRVLLGHSHGGSFVLYALFAQAAAAHHFSAYLASDASIGCMPATIYGWESSYAAANAALPVRVHLSYGANLDNEGFANQVRSRNYSQTRFASAYYAGGHIGMIPAAFSDAMRFALATA